MRRLNLHASALNDAEYALYTASLDDLAESHTSNDDDNRSYDDAYYDRLAVGVREARAWFRGRYSHVSVSDIDSILKYFHPNLGQSDTLTGGQFFAALRLVIHAEGGDGVERGLAFVQAHPNAKVASSPPKPHPPTPPPRQHPQSQSLPPSRSQSQKPHLQPRAPSKDRNPFTRQPSDVPPHEPGGQSSSSASPFTLVPIVSSSSNPTAHSQKVTHNPFLWRDKDKDKEKLPGSNGITPPLPPRKPPSLIPPPRHASLMNPLFPTPIPSSSAITPSPNANAAQTPPVIPSPLVPSTNIPGGAVLPGHVTSPLMRQSLQASKAAQTMKKAEEQLEKERVMRVLKKASAGPGNNGNGGAGKERVRSISPGRKAVGGTNGAGGPGSTSSEEHGRPPLPARRRKNSNPSSTSSSRRSLDQIASATVLPITGPGTSPTKGIPPKSPFSRPAQSNRHDEAITTNDTSPPTSASTSSPFSHQAPPTHPDRKPSHYPPMRTPERSYTTPCPTSPLSPTTASQPPRVFRSKSMHHPSPPLPPVPPPPRRKRPESVQVFGSGGEDENEEAERGRGREGTSPFFTPPHPHFASEPAQLSAFGTQSRSTPSIANFPGLSRHLSLSSPRRDSNGSHHNGSIASTTTSKRDSISSVHTAPESPIANLQRTITSLQLKAQPKIDAARYKAEAGLSKRGYVHHAHHSAWVEEGEEGLMGRGGGGGAEGARAGGKEDEGGIDQDYGYGGVVTDTDDEPSEEEEKEKDRQRRIKAGWDKGLQDNLKWPAGEGWKPL